MDFDQIRRYWDERAASDSSAQSTTQDYYLREIEWRVLHGALTKHKPHRVLDVGCGDAWITSRLASAFPDTQFVGGDYSVSMIKNAGVNIKQTGVSNIHLSECDITKPIQPATFDLIYTTRCLINLPSWDLQQTALQNIHSALDPGGVYVMIENFQEGHEAFNDVRTAFGLPRIAVREHNLFFERQRLVEFLEPVFRIDEEINISSTYYLASRVIYSRICQDRAVEPNYLDEHHRHASLLPFCGEYGPVRMLCLRK